MQRTIPNTELYDRDTLAKKIFEASYLRGEFKLRSGQTSNEYFDKYRFESRPDLLRSIAQQISALIPKDTEVLAGLEMGGIPIATAISLHTGLPVAFIRKTAKEYGTCQVAEGLELKGKKVLIIEDVITTGGQVILSATDLRSLGAEIIGVACVILRNKDVSKLTEAQLPVKPLFTMEELKKYQ